MRSAEEMDQADIELRETVVKVWPFTAKQKVEVLIPTTRGNQNRTIYRHLKQTIY